MWNGKNPLTALFTKPLASQLPGFAWYYSTVPLKNVPKAVNGSQWQEWSLETVLYGGRHASSFVNGTVSHEWENGLWSIPVGGRGYFTKVMNSLFAPYS